MTNDDNRIFWLNNHQQTRDYYCSLKFRYLKIDLESKTTYNCHAAAPHRVDFEWLSNHPNQLFNNTISVLERTQMIENKRNSSCEQNCWAAEDIGATSPRIYQKGYNKTHSQIVTDPEIVDITIGSDCNLTCSYCCKEFSSSWRRDIIKNGDYALTDYKGGRYTLNNYDKLIDRVSQPTMKTTKHYRLLLEQFFAYLPVVKKIDITGGEPFLDNEFFDELVERNTNSDIEINIYTGLKVSTQRLNKILDKLKALKNLTITVSGENIEQWLEFNRYGIEWESYLRNIDLIKSKNIKMQFHATISALTIFGFVEFVKYFKNEKINLTFAHQPKFIALHNIDEASKKNILSQIKTLPIPWQEKIAQSVAAESTDIDRINLGEFLTQFAHRRPALDLTIFPKTFLEWTNTHVVQ